MSDPMQSMMRGLAVIMGSMSALCAGLVVFHVWKTFHGQPTFIFFAVIFALLAGVAGVFTRAMWQEAARL